MNDVIDRTRPSTDGLTSEWAPADREALLSDIVSGGRLPGPVRRRRWPIAVAASILAAAMVSVPVLVPGWFTHRAAAEELTKVAHAAAAERRLEWSADEFLHVRTVETQTDALDSGSEVTGERRTVSDDFRTVDGWTWSDRTVTSPVSPDGRIERYIFPPTWGWMRPDYAATMPAEPHLLDAFLRARILGSSSPDEAVFVAVGDMLGQEAADPELRAAAIGVLGLNPHVTVERTRDPEGRDALKATFTDETTRPGTRQYLYLSPDTGALLGQGFEGNGVTYDSLVTLREVVDALPADLVGVLGTDKVGKDVSDGITTPISSDAGPDPTPVPEQTYTPAPDSPTPGR